ncbi:SDR family NAD(P)-dependent oxidoreductase [Bacillaceae bacterium W0354]
MKYAIVTGASRGLGLEVARNFIKDGYSVITLARGNPNLDELASKHKVSYNHFSVDLIDLKQLTQTLNLITSQLKEISIDELVVVNNAGTVQPIGPVGTLNNEDIANHVTLNMTTVMIIVNTIKQEVKANQSIFINVTSGAAERRVYGWNAYCATKAAINMYTEVSALEATERKTNDLHIAFSPGTMDTEMQKEICSVDEDDFIEVEKFKDFKKKGQLRNPIEVADLLSNLLKNKENLTNGKIYRVYDLVK